MTDASKEPETFKAYFWHWGHRYRTDKGNTDASGD